MSSTAKPIRLYIAGPMSGYDQLNFPAFAQAASDLRAAGYDIISPAEINAEHPQCWASCMRADIQQLMTCDGIAYLNGHEKSKGASIEVKLGHDLNMVVTSLNTWLLLAACGEPTCHGLGMIQLPISDTLRLHFWGADLPRRHCLPQSAVHNHRFTFSATVLRGEMTDCQFSVCEVGEGQHMRYVHRGGRGAHGNRDWTPVGTVGYTVQRRRTLTIGQQYVVRAYDYHGSEPAPNTITLVEKMSVYCKPASSIAGLHTVVDHAFDRHQLSKLQVIRHMLAISKGELEDILLVAMAESEHVVKNQSVIEASKIPTPDVDLGDLLKPNYNVARPALRTDVEGR